ncbi:extracellular solute-binding protein [Devosia rhodophyticola]|uniref:Extracellular solute-binding protein n=1 Tax=Devosia rhodophyticola TaxID=3026423 RepID=A0ABY7YV05_9HYPH|nr:extracellular solute-binding protein [Devosia rhodophyticola]WDR05198.1 extracellular solute-binding protein [Devosia rhodophyticola]
MSTFTSTPFNRRAILKMGAAAAAVAPFASLSGRTMAASGEPLTIMLLGPNSATVDDFKNNLLPAFTKESGIEVNLQTSDWGSGFQKVTTAAASGTLADIVMLGGIWTAPLADKGALLPLTDYLANWADRDSFYPAMIADGAYDGVDYALPIYADTRTALYRRDILEAVGVSESDLPKDWDSFKALAKTIAASDTSAKRTPVFWGTNKSIGLQQSFAQLILQNGGTYYGADGSAQFASDANVEALDYLVSFFRDGLSDVNQVFSGSGPLPVVSGNSAMTLNGFAEIGNARANAPDMVDQIIAGPPLAAKKGGAPVSSAWINKLGISAGSKNPDEAWMLLQHLLTKNNAEVISKDYGGLPGRKDLANADYLSGVSAGFTAASDYIVPQPANPNMLIIAKEINTAVEKAVRQMGEPAAVLAELDAKIDQINGR